MKIAQALLVVVALVLTGLALAGPPPGALTLARDGVTAVGPAYPQHARITCDTTAGGIEIKPPGGTAMVSYECTAKGTVYVGGGLTTLTTSTGVEFVDGDRFGANTRAAERCITTAGSVVLQCRFLVTSAQ